MCVSASCEGFHTVSSDANCAKTTMCPLYISGSISVNTHVNPDRPPRKTTPVYVTEKVTVPSTGRSKFLSNSQRWFLLTTTSIVL